VWLLFQSTIMIAVGWTGLYYEWTPNKTALGIVAVATAWWATRMVSAFLSWCRGMEMARPESDSIHLQRLRRCRPNRPALVQPRITLTSAFLLAR